MIKHTYLLFSLLLISSLLTACQPADEKNKESVEESTSIPPMIDAQFVCTSISDDETMPRSLVSFYMNGKVQALDTINSCELIAKEDFERYDIPAEAVTAAGGWWAGGGDYFYATVNGNVCTVMQGWQDEEQEDDGFHYEQIRRFVVSEK